MIKGDKYNLSFKITEAVYSSFIKLSNDRNPLHIDESFAIAKGFNGKVMHGNILNGFVSYFVGECLPIKNVMIISQEIKFYKPVYLNNELQMDIELTEVTESVNVYLFKFTFNNKTSGVKTASGKVQICIL